MKLLLIFFLLALVAMLCWPLALLLLIAWPILWLISIPFRIVGVLLDATVALIGALFFLPARLLGWRR